MGLPIGKSAKRAVEPGDEAESYRRIAEVGKWRDGGSACCADGLRECAVGGSDLCGLAWRLGSLGCTQMYHVVSTADFSNLQRASSTGAGVLLSLYTISQKYLNSSAQ